MRDLGRRARGAAGSDAGLSLAEMLIAMMMASIVMITLGTLFVGSLRENRTVIGKTNSTADARIAMEAMTRELRVATTPKGQTTALTSATATAVTFYSSIGASTSSTDPNPSLVTLRIDTTNKCLWREITPATVVGATLTWPTASKKAGCVARGNINASGADLFTYYPMNADGTVSTTAYTAGQLSANLDNIGAIGLALSVGDVANPAVNPTVLQDQVSLVNNIAQQGS
jgi:type II secretory pathway pseudopilin PulG